MLVEVAPIKVSPPSCNRVPGAVPHEGPASPSAGDTVSASSDSYDGGGEESKSRKLSKVGLRKLKIW